MHAARPPLRMRIVGWAAASVFIVSVAVGVEWLRARSADYKQQAAFHADSARMWSRSATFNESYADQQVEMRKRMSYDPVAVRNLTQFEAALRLEARKSREHAQKEEALSRLYLRAAATPWVAVDSNRVGPK